MQEVTVSIKKDGSITLDAKNFHGTVCKTTLDKIAKNIGVEDAKYTAKPEYYEENKESVSAWG